MSSEETSGEGGTGSSLFLNQPVVIDNGTATLKAGFAGSDRPKASRQVFDIHYFLLRRSNMILSLVVFETETMTVVV